MTLQTISLPAFCPKEPGKACGPCLQQRLAANPGMLKTRLLPGDSQETVRLDLEYDPRLITLTQLDEEIKCTGACCLRDRAEVVVTIDGLVSPRDEQAIEAALARMDKVVASASFASRTLRVSFSRSQCVMPEVARRLDALGFRLHPQSTPATAIEAAAPDYRPSPSRLVRAGQWLTVYRELVLAGIGGLLLLAGFIIHVSNGPEWLRLVLVGSSYLLTGWGTFIDTVSTLRRLQFDIDVLMFAAAIGAAALGHYEEGGLLLFLFALGGAGEELAMDRARHAIQALAKLAPETATVRDPDGRQRTVPVEQLTVGQQIIVKPSERIAADGNILTGESSVDQSPITGESVPVPKSAGAPVFAGTINGDGLLAVEVTRLASQSTLAKIVRMVNEAQTTKSPTQVFTDKVERWYVPIVLIATAALIILPPVLGAGAWATWFYRAMAFLTAASPCALAIGTPAAVLSGIARAARLGVLVKGGAHLENLGRVRAVALDKTGTLTRGRPQLTDIVSLNGDSESALLGLAAAVERGSTHPLALAIVAESAARSCPEPHAEQTVQVPGKGVTAQINGQRIAVGHPDLVPAGAELTSTRQAIERLSKEGKTTVVVAIDSVPAGVIALADRPRPNAARALRRLKEIGIERTIMLTGDNRTVAAAVASEVGVDEHIAEMLPEEKVQRLRELQQRYGRVAMVGDGVNDAPAMATASVGIAMGGAGTDVAIETADVALMADDLDKLPDAIALSRFSRRIIVQNLMIALGVIAILAPAAALGLAYLGVAVLFHEGSTVVVVLNSLRLLVYKPPRPRD